MYCSYGINRGNYNKLTSAKLPPTNEDGFMRTKSGQRGRQTKH